MQIALQLSREAHVLATSKSVFPEMAVMSVGCGTLILVQFIVAETILSTISGSWHKKQITKKHTNRLIFKIALKS